MKTIAMYLPQFHRIPENDKWWGEGYTEWTAVKNAKPEMKDHDQPRIPLNNNYYDLMDKSTMEWQSQLMQEYQVYGLCFYHYYFKDGKKVLERPAENLLKWKDINMPFCFSWANETWARTWSKISTKNTWNKKQEKREEDGDGILLQQDYGDEREWRQHLEYLIPFFQDDRYIKKNGNPIFVIHRPDNIHCLKEMKDKWNEWIADYGFEKLYFIGTNSDWGDLDAVLQQESNYSDLFIPYKNKPYDLICEQMLVNASLSDSKRYLCGMPGYDDSPRRGADGEIIYNSSPNKFFKQLRALLYFSQKKGMDYLFINAWNEWGEGMYLEPDEQFEYGYLEAVRDALSNHEFTEKEIGCFEEIISNGIQNQIKWQREKYLNLRKTSEIIEELLYFREKKRSLAEILREKGFQSAGIYGLGKIGNHVVSDLLDADYQISFGVDRSVTGDCFAFSVYRPSDSFPKADVLLVTIHDESVYYYLKEKVSYPVILIEELLWSK